MSTYRTFRCRSDRADRRSHTSVGLTHVDALRSRRRRTADRLNGHFGLHRQPRCMRTRESCLKCEGEEVPAPSASSTMSLDRSSTRRKKTAPRRRPHVGRRVGGLRSKHKARVRLGGVEFVNCRVDFQIRQTLNGTRRSVRHVIREADLAEQRVEERGVSGEQGTGAAEARWLSFRALTLMGAREGRTGQGRGRADGPRQGRNDAERLYPDDRWGEARGGRAKSETDCLSATARHLDLLFSCQPVPS